jgi:chromosome partitioning protein
VSVVSKYGDVCQVTQELAGKYENTIIDAGGRDSRELRSALLAADVALIPIKASQLDLWTHENMNEKIALARGFNRRLAAIAVLSMAPTNSRVRETAEAQQVVREFDELELAEAVIHERKTYRDAMRLGCGVVETDNDKASREIEALARDLRLVAGDEVSGAKTVKSTDSRPQA